MKNAREHSGGFTTITVSRDTHKKIMERAHLAGKSAAELVEAMFEVYEEERRPHRIVDSIFRLLREIPQFSWPAFPAVSPIDPYQAILMEPDVEAYRSTAWVRSEEYPDTVGLPQFRPVARSFLGELKIQKMLILSPQVWNSKKVWEWVLKWVVLHYILGDDLQTFVVPEKDIPKNINKKYLDMGIYGNLVIGYLQLSEKSEPLIYTWIKTREELKTAKDIFDGLKSYAVKPEEYIKFQLPSQKKNV